MNYITLLQVTIKQNQRKSSTFGNLCLTMSLLSSICTFSSHCRKPNCLKLVGETEHCFVQDLPQSSHDFSEFQIPPDLTQLWIERRARRGGSLQWGGREPRATTRGRRRSSQWTCWWRVHTALCDDARCPALGSRSRREWHEGTCPSHATHDPAWEVRLERERARERAQERERFLPWTNRIGRELQREDNRTSPETRSTSKIARRRWSDEDSAEWRIRLDGGVIWFFLLNVVNKCFWWLKMVFDKSYTLMNI